MGEKESTAGHGSGGRFKSNTNVRTLTLTRHITNVSPCHHQQQQQQKNTHTQKNKNKNKKYFKKRIFPHKTCISCTLKPVTSEAPAHVCSLGTRSLLVPIQQNPSPKVTFRSDHPSSAETPFPSTLLFMQQNPG